MIPGVIENREIILLTTYRERFLSTKTRAQLRLLDLQDTISRLESIIVVAIISISKVIVIIANR